MADSAEPRQPQTARPAARRYSAFISYSQADARFVRRLHRQLESYRLPARLAGGGGGAARRLKPVFRDNDELSAGHDVTEAVREALAQSGYLIVVCSPRSAQSKWVGREVELFRRLHGDRAILTALMDGEPETAFHPALRRHAHGRATEPLAADFRPKVGGGRMALLKLVAPMAGVALDDLIHRDGQRRMRQVMAGAGGAVAAVAIVATLAVVALNATKEADAQARRANGLGDFMVSDLRKGLEAAGRHDLLKRVNEAALKSYATTDSSRLPPDQALQTAAGLQGVAKDAEKSGDLAAAEANAEKAHRMTAALLAQKPKDAKRLFAHAQSEYWLGFIRWKEGDGPAAKAHFTAYARLADSLVAVDSGNYKSVLEKVYAAHDQGALTLRQAGDPAAAERYFQTALATTLDLARRNPDTDDILAEEQSLLAWLADAQRLQGHLDAAARTREEQETLLKRMLARDPRDHTIKAQMLFHDLAVARLAEAAGDRSRALALLNAGHAQALSLQTQDPDVKDYAKQARMFELFKARLWMHLAPSERPPNRQIADLIGDCAVRGTGADYLEISDFCRVLLARLRAEAGDAVGAQAALGPVRSRAMQSHDVLTARWGLDLAAEARPLHFAEGGAR